MSTGYVKFSKPVVLGELVTKLHRRIDSQLFIFDIFHRIIPVLKKFEGKKVTKRLETVLKGAFPLDRVWLEHIGGMTNIKFIKEGTTNESRSFLLCYTSSYGDDPGIYHEDRFINKYNSWVKSIPDDIKRAQQGLIKVPTLVERYNKILQEAQSLADDAAVVGLEYDLDIVCTNS